MAWAQGAALRPNGEGLIYVRSWGQYFVAGGLLCRISDNFVEFPTKWRWISQIPGNGVGGMRSRFCVP